MSTRFYPEQINYIQELNALDDQFHHATESALNYANQAQSSADSAEQSEINAGDAKTIAQTAKNAAESARTYAANSAQSAAASEQNSSAIQTDIKTIYDDLNTRYLGAKNTQPDTDNEGQSLMVGALYFNTSMQELMVYDGNVFRIPASSTQAVQAAASATDAVAAKNAAQTSANAALNSQAAATLSAANAEDSATAAQASEMAATSSATDATNAKANANHSAIAAELSANNATASAITALSAQNDAVIAATSAGHSATAAASSESSVSQAQTAATNAATNAANSESMAINSATAAADSATAAANSADNASTSETNAANSASNIATAELNSANFATHASASEVKAKQWADENQNTEIELGKYSARHWAMQAQASATGSLVYRGSLDASQSDYPSDPKLGDYYKISIPGSISGTAYATGDSIIYNGSAWDKIDNSELVTSVAGKTAAVTLEPADVGLAQVDNTRDLDKAISTATQTALNGKIDSSRVLTDVPAGAIFTDTTYNLTSSSNHGLMANTDKSKLDSIDPEKLLTTDTDNLFQGNRIFSLDGSNYLTFAGSGSANGSSGFWKSIQIGGPKLSEAAAMRYPQTALYWQSSQANDPSDLRFVIKPGNVGSLNADLELNAANQGKVKSQHPLEINCTSDDCLMLLEGHTSHNQGFCMRPYFSKDAGDINMLDNLGVAEPNGNLDVIKGISHAPKLDNSAFNVSRIIGSYQHVALNANYTGTVDQAVLIEGGGFDVLNGSINHAYGLKIDNITQGTQTNDAIKTGAGRINFNHVFTIDSSTGNTFANGAISSATVFSHINVSSRDKFRLWSHGAYSIGMGQGYGFGSLNDYAMTFQMNNDPNRGFWWGNTAHSNSQGAMALSSDGKLTIADSIRVGYGESDTTTAGATSKLDVNGNISMHGDKVATETYVQENNGMSVAKMFLLS